jgi:hypothetical protein
MCKPLCSAENLIIIFFMLNNIITFIFFKLFYYSYVHTRLGSFENLIFKRAHHRGGVSGK